MNDNEREMKNLQRVQSHIIFDHKALPLIAKIAIMQCNANAMARM